VDDDRFGKDVILALLADSRGNLWIGGTLGLIERTAAGAFRRFDSHTGLPEDWCAQWWRIATETSGPAPTAELPAWKATGSRYRPRARRAKWCAPCSKTAKVTCGWGATTASRACGTTSFTPYGKTEGMPSDEPNTVFQDHTGRLWVGFHDAGLMLFSPGQPRLFSRREGMPDTEIFSIRETPGAI
jgi:hypothetical protein